MIAMEKVVLEELIDRGFSTREMANYLDASQSSIAYQLKKHSLKSKFIRNNPSTKPLCRECGEEDPKKFYSYRKLVCRLCDNTRVLNKQREMRERARQQLGGKCSVCGYSKCNAALEVHHIDASKKDTTFRNNSSWSWSRLLKELEG